jgi:hypothetical protein
MKEMNLMKRIKNMTAIQTQKTNIKMKAVIKDEDNEYDGKKED